MGVQEMDDRKTSDCDACLEETGNIQQKSKNVNIPLERDGKFHLERIDGSVYVIYMYVEILSRTISGRLRIILEKVLRDISSVTSPRHLYVQL